MGNSPTKPETEASKPAKRSRDHSQNQSTSPKKPKITIDSLNLVDINNDCLEAIFEYLDLADLLNISECDERFAAVAQSVYSRHYRAKNVLVNLESIGFKTTDDNDDLEIGKENAEAFLLRFGHLIWSLSFNSMAEHAINIEKSLLKHCSDSLTVLELDFCRANHFETLTEPLEKIVELTITKSFLGRKLSQLNIWFPSLASLELIQVELMQPKSLEVNFPRLKHLVIYNKEHTIPQQTIGELLRLNPQLVSLVLQCKLDVDFLRCIAERTPHLEALELWASNERFESFGDQKFSFENVKEFKLNSWFHWGEFLVDVPFKFNKLQKLKLDGFNEFKGEMIKFIKQNRDVNTLSLMPYIDDWDDLAFDDLESIVDTLPLVELEFCADMFTGAELILFLSKYKDLTKVQLWFLELPECICQLENAIKVEWIFTAKMGCLKYQDCMLYVCIELERKK